MILCIDAGNSRIKLGLWANGGWLSRDSVAHDEIDAWLATASRGSPAVSRVLACNVAGVSVRGAIERIAAALNCDVEWFSSAGECAGVRNGYQQPEQLGADRWAALIAARGLQLNDTRTLGKALLVMMAGTATTIDGLDPDGCFRGGVILPGLALMRQSLARGTAQLPEASGEFVRWPANTNDAIVSGSVQATLGAFERIRRNWQDEWGIEVLGVVAGGAANVLMTGLGDSVIWQPDLVLEGLLRFAGVSQHE